ncbi:gluconate 2-dehydrogenase subunit 3-like protein [Dyadobacter jejuensis]|uniref:Gluconate 2-dehydrogenase subunit 3-like protein n=1 Tax=Dyadobacter jejuensis TaxID=1082580 RepID=A0A316AN83_9BACT|nr:gluconate 2-dehydrogenase subunit 3 family protein [Dyadobacter jejuensis]PWJ58769.1 gluconate 2-dehydrogenase subunit 3-like protein [Dyadobacter jejuensis]
MNRRVAVQRITMMLGGVISAPLMAGILNEKTNHGGFIDPTAEQKLLIAEVADVIIPTTTTPGAKAAGAEDFIIRVLRDCYELPAQQQYYKGLGKLDALAKSKFGKGFVALSTENKNAVVLETTKVDKPFFKMMKDLTVTAYFTSEIGCTQALDYLPIPGRFEGTWPMPKGQKSWAL